MLRAPTGTVFRHDDGRAVFRIDGDRAEIIDGLTVGDRLIVHPDRELEADARVRAR